MLQIITYFSNMALTRFYAIYTNGSLDANYDYFVKLCVKISLLFR